MLKLQAKGVAIWADEHHWTVHCVRSSEWSTFQLHLCISYQSIWGCQHLQKSYPKCHFTYIFCYFHFALALHPWLCWLLELSQILGSSRQLQTCARLMQGWVASAGCPPPPPNKNPGYAGASSRSRDGFPCKNGCNDGSAGSRLRGARGIYYPRGPLAADLQHLSLQRVQEKQWGQKERGYRMAVLTE